MEKKAEKLMDVAKIGAKGQIVIPKSMRDMFGLRPGDTLLLLADESRGIAMNKLDLVAAMEIMVEHMALMDLEAWI